MKLMRTHWVNRLAALGLVVGLTVGFSAVGVAQSVSGTAYGAYVNTPAGSLAQSPLATLPYTTAPEGNMATASADALSVPNTLSSEFLNSTATGAAGSAGATATSIATVANVTLLGGLITAKELVATATSWRSPGGAHSSAQGSTFEDLTVNGVPVTSGDGAVGPNTRIDLPGVGYAVLNEQRRSGNGVSSGGITVNMIHVYLQSVTGGGCTLLGCVPGVLTTTGEIIVGSASSRVN